MTKVTVPGEASHLGELLEAVGTLKPLDSEVLPLYVELEVELRAKFCLALLAMVGSGDVKWCQN